MIIKKFRAEKMEDAKKIAQESLGPDAIVLSSKPVREKGIKALFSQDAFEVTAAVDENDLASFEKNKSASPRDPLDDSLAEIKRVLGKISSEVDGKDEGFSASKDQVSISQQALSRGRVFAEQKIKKEQSLLKESLTESTVLAIPEMEKFEESIRRIIKEELALLDTKSPEMTYLLSKGIDQDLAQEIVKGLGRFTTKDKKQYFSALKQKLKDSVPCQGPIYLRQGLATVLAVVGSRGVGKSSTAICIAKQYQELDKKVLLISFDEKTARDELLQSLKVGFEFCVDTKQLKQIIDKYAHYDLIIVDTMAFNPTQKSSIQELQSTLSCIEDLSTFLVLSANMSQEDLKRSFKVFDKQQIDSMVFTRLDESSTLASIVNTAWQSKLPLRFVSERGKNDLKVADASKIVKAILLQK